MNMTTNTDIIALLRDVSHKLDGVVDRVGSLEGTIRVDAALTVQTRDIIHERIAAIETALTDDIKPQTDSLKQMKLVGIGFLSIVGMGGMTLGGMLVYAGDSVVVWLRHWLKLS